MENNIIYTPQFKQWFGDWENNPQLSSKVVDENGVPLIVYHGTDGEFNEFKSKFMGQTGTAKGQGFYFTAQEEYAKQFGTNVKAYYLNIRKPLSSTELTITKKQFTTLLDSIDKAQSQMEEGFEYGILSDYGDVDYKGRDAVLKYAVDLEMNSSDNDIELIGGIINASGNYNLVTNILFNTLGYDGIIAEENRIYVAHHSNQIKEITNQTFNNGSMKTNESINKKRIFITEAQLNTLLNEDKRTEQAKTRCLNVIRSHFNNEPWLDTTFNHNDNPGGLSYIDYMFKQFMQTFYHNPQLRSGATMRLAPLFCKLAFEANFQNNNPDVDKLHRLERILNFIYEMALAKKLDISKISLDATYDQLDSMFGVQIDTLDKEENERMANKEYTKNNEYSIIGPVDFETAKKYGNMSCPGSKLCYTQSLYTWNDYTKKDAYNVYIVLRNGWDKITPEHDSEENSAYDTYGLSMIFVFVNSKGDLVYCNTRWNHDANYAQGCSCDHAMTREMICDLIGGSFEENFPAPEKKVDPRVKELLTMTEIPSNYFSGSDIEDIVIPNNITSIGDKAFYECDNLTSVTIPNSVTSIGYYAFEGCSSLKSITIPDSVTVIEIGVFSDCSSLTNINIPNSVTSIGNYAFYDCSSLTNINIPNSVKSIGESAFFNCISLASITIPNSVARIRMVAFAYCSSLKSITIPNSVTSIEASVFADCSSLTSITIPNSVTSIEYGAFQGCISLTSITIPNSVTYIGEEAFSGCERLKNVTIPSRYREMVKVIFSRNPQINFIDSRATNESINKKRIFITESQFNNLKNLLNEEKFYVDTQKVLIVKKYLDKNFSRGSMNSIGPDGYPKKTNVIGMKDNNGEVFKNMTFEQMLDLLEDKFHTVYTDKTKRSKFLKQVLNDWYNKKISKEGLLSVNTI